MSIEFINFQFMTAIQIAQYKLEKVLGEGSFGKVYQSINTQTNLPVAVKQINKQLIHQD